MMAQPGRAGPHGDHADRMAGGVVQVAGDPGALLGHGEQALAFGVPLSADGTCSEFSHLRPPQAGAFTGKPGHGPGETGMKQRDSRKGPRRGGGRAQVGHEQPDHGRRDPRRPRGLRPTAGREQVEGGGGTGDQVGRIAEASQQYAGRRSHHEYAEREASPGNERHSRADREHGTGQIDATGSGAGRGDAAVTQQRQRAGERPRREGEVDERSRAGPGREKPVDCGRR
jgi:hypothetical protein